MKLQDSKESSTSQTLKTLEALNEKLLLQNKQLQKELSLSETQCLSLEEKNKVLLL
jgi:hypothetical protein